LCFTASFLGEPRRPLVEIAAQLAVEVANEFVGHKKYL